MKKTTSTSLSRAERKALRDQRRLITINGHEISQMPDGQWKVDTPNGDCYLPFATEAGAKECAYMFIERDELCGKIRGALDGK
jgi:hypothetical protein